MDAPTPTPRVPALQPPPGVTADFVNPPTLRPLLDALIGFSMVLLVGVLALRIWVKVRLVHRWFLDDTMSVVAVVLFMVWLGISVTKKYGDLITRNQWNLYLDEVPYVLFFEYVLMLVYPPCMLAAKLSVLLQIERLFAVQRDAFFYFAWTTIGIITMYYSASLFMFAFQCSPPRKAWNTELEGRCTSPFLLETVQAGFNLISDIVTVILPMWAIFSMRIGLKKRLELLAIFNCGFLACALSICGMVFRIQLYDNPDQMRAIFIIGCFCSGETIMVILVGCVPAISKLFFRESWGRRRSDAAAVVHGSPEVLDAHGSPPSPGQGGRPNRFLQANEGLADSRWRGTGVFNSLARYLGPNRELARDRRPDLPSRTEKLPMSEMSSEMQSSLATTSSG